MQTLSGIPFISAGYELIGLMILAVLVAAPLALSFCAFCDWVKSRCMGTTRRLWLIRAAIIADAVLVLCAVDAWLIEPKTLTVTRVSAASPKIAPETGTLKIIHISDIHFELRTSLTEKIINVARKEKPDLILLTGDLHQLGSCDAAEFSRFLVRLCSIAPAYAVIGYDEEATLDSASQGRLHIIENRSEERLIRGTCIRIQGLHTWVSPAQQTKQVSPDTLFVVPSHSPDMLHAALKLRPDWYFCGHTHGGQVRLPFWGAITTASHTGKRYEYGRYKVGKTDMFVTRGIGLEPRPAPRVRFLCPPEIAVVSLTRPSDNQR